jgi:hypothetical protein
MGMLAVGGPCHALPVFARQYGETCQKCHSIAPRLNPFGLAFQANHYNWPGKKPTPGKPGRKSKIRALPFSGVATFTGEDNRTEGKSTGKFSELEIFAANGFGVGRQRRGGYFVDTIAATREEDERAGNLEKAFVALPVVGRRGQGALTVGQFTPLTYQWDPHPQLAETSPFALADEVGGFSFTEAVPGLRAEYFNHRGQDNPSGDYLLVGVPFQGRLTLNRHARWGGPQGVYAHGFRRWGYNSAGLFGYTHAGNHLEGVLGTYALRPNLFLLGAAAVGHDEEGATRRLSLEGEYLLTPRPRRAPSTPKASTTTKASTSTAPLLGEYVPVSRLALTARLEVLGGRRNDLGEVVAVTYYPFKLPMLRLTAEMVQRKGDRAFILFARGQF